MSMKPSSKWKIELTAEGETVEELEADIRAKFEVAIAVLKRTENAFYRAEKKVQESS